MPLGKFFYVMRTNDDGTPAVDFYADKEAAQLACDIETQGGKSAVSQGIELEFDAGGKLLTPDAAIEELRERLAQMPAAKRPVAEEKPAEPTVSASFSESSRPPRTEKPAPAPMNLAEKFPSLDGKVVAFSGGMSMNPPRIKEFARSLGVRVAAAVTDSTDILVVGEDPGIKLERAKEYGVLIITEQQWFDLASRVGKPKPSPGL